MTHMSAPLTVTLVVIAYNQEAFIGDAIRGALAQTHSPMKIILSDDRSPDRTYEIMQQIAAGYDGPHEIVLRRSAENRGVLGHVNEIAALVDTDVVVMAAGDDVSYPQRVETIMRVFNRDPSVMAVLSDHHVADTPARLDPGDCRAEYVAMREIMFHGGGIGAGAAYAYRRECFFWPGALNADLFSEDRILPLRAALLGRVCKLPYPLLFYRQIEGSVGNRLNTGKTWVVTHKPHEAEIRRELAVAVAENRISARQSRAAMFWFRAHGLCAGFMKRRGRPGDMIWRYLGRNALKLFRTTFVSRQRQTFRL